jgi:hypothetical protein
MKKIHPGRKEIFFLKNIGQRPRELYRTSYKRKRP